MFEFFSQLTHKTNVITNVLFPKLYDILVETMLPNLLSSYKQKVAMFLVNVLYFM